MSYESIIVKELKFISEKFDSLRVSHSTELLYHYEKLGVEKKDDYVSKYEFFFYIFSTFRFIVDDLLMITSNLEDIQKERDRQITETQQLASGFISESQKDICHLTTWLFNAISILMQNSLKNIPNLGNSFFVNDYPEMTYINSLRNEFLQHPKSEIPFHLVGASSISGSNQLIPYAFIAPGGGGLAMLTRHHLKKIKDIDFLKMSSHEQLQSNKKEFSNSSYLWQRGKIDEDLICKIKAVGLPAYDQRALTQELKNLFTKVVLPFVFTEYENAIQMKILLT